MRTTLLTIAGLLLATVTEAQTPAPYDHRLRVYTQTGTVPIQTTTAPASAATCGLDPTPPTTTIVVNPTDVEYNDPQVTGKVCRLPLASFFGGLPLGQYVARLALVDRDSQFLESPSAVTNPFERRAAPPSPINPRVIGGGGF